MADSLNSIVGAVRASSRSSSHPAQPLARPKPFITIARQAGAGAWTLAQRLSQRLNEIDPGPKPWTVYNRELIQAIADDLKLSTRLIETIEESSHTWLTTLLDGLTFNGPTELKIFNRMTATIYGLAQAGRSIIVGRGGVFITGNLPGGIHVYLIAPEEYRIHRMTQYWQGTRDEIARRIREIDQARESYYKHYFPRHPKSLDAFTVTINVAAVSEDNLVEMLLQLVPRSAVAINTTREPAAT